MTPPPVAGLLVSVRSADEARAAVAGGAAVIDVKEPSRGPLGRADLATWRAVRRAVPPGTPLSVALGELPEWDSASLVPDAFAGVSYRKIGLAGSGPGWRRGWDRLRAYLGPGGPPWVAVAYADWRRALAPDPDLVVAAAAEAGCAGLLVDTWDKARAAPLDATWAPLVGRARAAGLFVALAGGLDAAAIVRLAPLAPDLFAVRGAACAGGDRLGPIDADRVRRLAAIARGAVSTSTRPGLTA